MTLHLNVSESVSQKILSFLESLSKQGESVEVIDDSLYKFEKVGIIKGLQQLDDGEYISSEDLIADLSR